VSPFILFIMSLRHLAGNSKLKVAARGVAANTKLVVEINNLTSNQTFAGTGNARGSNFITTIAADTRGVVDVKIKDANGGIVRQYVTVGVADIDCCIAKLVHDAINCTCKCNKCKEDLDRAQTIRLLIQAAKYEAKLGLVDSVQDKYNKAKELCTEVCACGC